MILPLLGIGLIISGAGLLYAHWRRLNTSDLGSIPMENLVEYERRLTRDPGDPYILD